MRLMLGLLMAVIFSGCSFLRVNRVKVYSELKKNPVEQVLVLKPGFGKKPKKHSFPGDLWEIESDYQDVTGLLLQKALETALNNAGLQVELYFVPSEKIRVWAKKIATNVGKDMMPFRVEPMDLSAESVLLFGVIKYGRIMTQFRWKSFFEKKWHVVGRLKWEHVCDIQAILVNPRTGKILMEVRHRVKIVAYKKDPELMKQVTTEVMQAIANAFPK